MVIAQLLRLNIGLKTGGEIVSKTRFTENIVMIAQSENNIQRVVSKMNEMLRTTEISLNSVKTKMQVCARDPQIQADVYITNHRLDQEVEMVYFWKKHPTMIPRMVRASEK